jgi:hypothetical protein
MHSCGTPPSATRRCVRFGALALFGLCAAGTRAADRELSAIAREQLCVTEGSVGTAPLAGWWEVGDSKMRAYIAASTGTALEARFRYLGATREQSQLGSGQVRRQFGLKLRAQDACNLVYAMWRIEPEAKLVVSVKSNPGQHTSAACGNRGYRNLKPQRAGALPTLRAGDEHSLRAQMSGAELEVFADDALVWQGAVGEEALALNGPVGMRSDNAHLLVRLRAPAVSHAATAAPLCQSAAGESD